jgi:uncharacterized Zn-binding protein involved in type VI secretion
MRRPNIDGRGQALQGDRTTTGAILISYIAQYARCDGRGFVLRGDKTSICPKCEKPGVISEGAEHRSWRSIPLAVDGCIVSCGCPTGSNRVIAPLGALSEGTFGASTSATAIANKQLKANNSSNTIGAEKKITRLYWSHGNNLTRLNEISRHYTDLNLHINTENYYPGEQVIVEIEFSKGDAHHYQVPIDADGHGVIKNIFAEKLIALNYEENQ